MGIAQQLEVMELSSSQTVSALAQADIMTEAVKKEGRIAYAYRQAAIRDKMLNHCKLQWEKYKTLLTTLEEFDPKVMIECHFTTSSNQHDI